MSTAQVGDVYREGRTLYQVVEIGEISVGCDMFLQPCIGFRRVKKTSCGYVRVDRGGRHGDGWTSCSYASPMAEFMELVERRQ